MISKYGQTDIHPLALLLTLAMGVAMLNVKRDRAVIPLLIVACLVTHAQRVVVGGFDFSMLRLIILFGWARVLYRGEVEHYRYHPVDAALVTWQLLATLAYVLGPRGELEGSFVFRLGMNLDALGVYFLFRVMLRDFVDIHRSIGAFSWIALAMVIPMVVEYLTGRNVFSLLGGVPDVTRIRDGRLRCQASFSHPIMAGAFGATTAALVAALFVVDPKRRVRHGLAVLAASAIVILSASSGPLMAWVTAIIGWGLWRYRRRMRALRWATLALLIVLHFVREKPVWHLIARVSSVTGGTGYHRFKLIDEFIRHFDEWWLVGMGRTVHWDIAQSSDITNQYVLEGVRGGLPTLVAFVTVLVLGFRTVGRSVKRAQSNPNLSRIEGQRVAILGWGLGVCLATHCMAFIGVSYFGQLNAILYLHLAMIPSYACALSRLPAEPVRVRISPPARARGAPSARAQVARGVDRSKA